MLISHITGGGDVQFAHFLCPLWDFGCLTDKKVEKVDINLAVARALLDHPIKMYLDKSEGPGGQKPEVTGPGDNGREKLKFLNCT